MYIYIYIYIYDTNLVLTCNNEYNDNTQSIVIGEAAGAELSAPPETESVWLTI